MPTVHTVKLSTLIAPEDYEQIKITSFCDLSELEIRWDRVGNKLCWLSNLSDSCN